MTEPSLTRRLARLVRGREVEGSDLRAAGRCVRNWLGSYVAGAADRPGRIVRRYADAGGRGGLEGRAFEAAALSHVTETDDLHRGSTTHPGCVVIPAAWIAARDAGADGAALLAREGFTGAERILEGETGFFRGFCPDPRPDAVLRGPDGWKLHETSLKPYPCCRHTHPAVNAALELRDGLDIHRNGGDGVDEVRIASYGAALRRTDRPRPSTPHAARFSIQHCAAVALLYGVPEPESFEPARIRDPGLRALLERTAVSRDDELDAAHPERWGGEVRLRTAAGEIRRARVRDARGDPERPLPDDEVDRKARSLLSRGGLDPEEADALLERCRSLHRGGALFDLPRPAGGDRAAASG